jgi:hypothetical protein
MESAKNENQLMVNCADVARGSESENQSDGIKVSAVGILAWTYSHFATLAWNCRYSRGKRYVPVVDQGILIV